jgi:hypothetical protein
VCRQRHPLGNATRPIAEAGALLVVAFRGEAGRPQRFVGRYSETAEEAGYGPASRTD